jgi:hypothetical protein
MKVFIIAIFLSILFYGCNKIDSDIKTLKVNKITIGKTLNFKTISKALEKETNLQSINLVGWKEFPYKPKVDFRIAHIDSIMFLKFYVNESHILAKRSSPNSATHKDSCVEFFIDPIGDGNYYNFEFNCIGTTHLAYGDNRHQRTFVPIDLISDQIRVWSTLGNKTFEEKSGNFYWEMVILVPSSIFVNNVNFSFTKLTANANFYKCGDETQKPHYLSWNPVKTSKPDFHRPEYFGKLIFE